MKRREINMIRDGSNSMQCNRKEEETNSYIKCYYQQIWDLLSLVPVWYGQMDIAQHGRDLDSYDNERDGEGEERGTSSILPILLLGIFCNYRMFFSIFLFDLLH